MATEIKMPADTAKKYRFTKPIYGGPVFDFPAFGMTNINLSELTEQQAARLLAKGWAGIERVAEFAEAPVSIRQPKEQKGE